VPFLNKLFKLNTNLIYKVRMNLKQQNFKSTTSSEPVNKKREGNTKWPIANYTWQKNFFKTSKIKLN
jgi:hypothetical protein